jgi:hypothetical protein
VNAAQVSTAELNITRVKAAEPNAREMNEIGRRVAMRRLDIDGAAPQV